MKYFFLFLFTAFTKAYSQELGYPDSLRKYSYHIQPSNLGDTVKEVYLSQGTGFFIKKQNRTDFITARHVLVGCNYYGEKINAPFTDAHVMYNTEIGLKIAKRWYYKIPNAKTEYICYPTYQKPDTITQTKTDTAKVFSIENLISEDPISNNSRLVIYGFPILENLGVDGGYYSKEASRIYSTDYSIDSFFYVSDRRNSLHKDTINYRILLKDYKVSDKMAGFSGSPVFLYNNRKKKWYFLGLLTAIEANRNFVFVVKAKHIVP